MDCPTCSRYEMSKTYQRTICEVLKRWKGGKLCTILQITSVNAHAYLIVFHIGWRKHILLYIVKAGVESDNVYMLLSFGLCCLSTHLYVNLNMRIQQDFVITSLSTFYMIKYTLCFNFAIKQLDPWRHQKKKWWGCTKESKCVSDGANNKTQEKKSQKMTDFCHFGMGGGVSYWGARKCAKCPPWCRHWARYDFPFFSS